MEHAEQLRELSVGVAGHGLLPHDGSCKPDFGDSNSPNSHGLGFHATLPHHPYQLAKALPAVTHKTPSPQIRSTNLHSIDLGQDAAWFPACTTIYNQVVIHTKFMHMEARVQVRIYTFSGHHYLFSSSECLSRAWHVTRSTDRPPNDTHTKRHFWKLLFSPVHQLE